METNRWCDDCVHWKDGRCADPTVDSDYVRVAMNSAGRSFAHSCNRFAKNTGSSDTKPLTAPWIAPIPENPVVRVEDELRVSTLRQAKDAIGKLAALLDGTPAAASRALHLIGETAAVYGEMLAAIGVPGVGRKRNKGLVGNYIAGGGNALALGDSLGGMETSPGGETYGNQALSQFNAGIKQIAELMAGRKDKPRKPKGATAFDIESLTRAYANAKREAVDPEIVAKLKSRLEEALAAQEWGPEIGAEVGDPLPELPIAPLLEGVARGVAAHAGLPVIDEEAGALAPALDATEGAT